MLRYCILILFATVFYSALGQTTILGTDSLSKLNPGRSSLTLPKAVNSFLKGIAASSYRKINTIENFPVSAIELPSVFLSTGAGHPRLLSPSQMDQAKRSIFRPPFSNWFHLLKEKGDRYLRQSHPILDKFVIRQAEDFKDLAFLYQITGEKRYLEIVADLMHQLPDPPKILNFEGGPNNTGWGDFLQSAQAIIPILVALDLIYNDLEHSIRTETRGKLMRIANQLSDALIITPTNNHTTVFTIAILVAAIAEDHPREFIAMDRQELWQTGLDYLSRSLGLIAPDGGYAEGAYYGRFIANYLSPFSVYFENTTGLRLFEHPYLERMLQWILANDKGSGRFSAFDDAFQVDFFFIPPIIPQSRQDGNLQAYWEAQPPLTRAKPNLVEAICVFKVRGGESIMTEPAVQFFPESGSVVFRDRNINPQVFASFISEREQWFADRHEHIDPLSFEISAFGKDLIVDGGYGSGTGDTDRNWYLSAQANNGILIDGLGTYLNPIWGDEVSSSLTASFQTQKSASTTMISAIGDMDLRRQIYFLENRYFLMIDEFSGNIEHSVALNFNFLGELRQHSPNRLAINNEQTALDVFCISSPEEEPSIIKDFSFYTPPGKPQPNGSFQIEHQDVRQGYFLTVLYPHQTGGNNIEFLNQPVQGNGDLFRFQESGAGVFSQTDIAVNRGRILVSDQWKSDAQTLWIQYDASFRISGLLLVNFTKFNSSQLTLTSNFPITIFLEDLDGFWQGYISTRDNRVEYTLTIEGIWEMPFRFNRAPVKEVIGGDKKKSFLLKGAGIVEIGSGITPVKVPYRFHRPPSLLKWLSKQQNPHKAYQYASDYQRRILKNQIANNMLIGLDAGLGYWSNRIFNNPKMALHTAYTLSGIAQKSYDRNSSSNFTIDIPHRYQLKGNAVGLHYSLFEEGTFSPTNLNIQNLQLRARWQNGAGVRYRTSRRFSGQQSHQIRLISGNGSQGFYQIAKHEGQQEQQVQFQFHNNRLLLNPGYSWRNKQSENTAFLNWRYRQYHGGLRKQHHSGGDNYYQSFNGFGNRWAFSAQGHQSGSNKIQQYSANWLYRPARELLVSQGGILNKEDGWNFAKLYTAVTWQQNNLGLVGRVEKLAGQYFQQFALNSQIKNHRLSGNIDLTEFRFGKLNLLQLRWGYRKKRLSLNSYFRYQYWPEKQKYGGDILHSLWIPLNDHYFWQPVFGETFPENSPLQLLGSGFAFQGKYSVYSQILYDRLQRPYSIDYQLSISVNRKSNFSLTNIWFNFQQTGTQLQFGEIRILKADQLLQPGLYYSYLRGSGSRLEGSLSWVW